MACGAPPIVHPFDTLTRPEGRRFTARWIIGGHLRLRPTAALSDAPVNPAAPSPAIVVEAALLCAGRSLSLAELVSLFDGELDETAVHQVIQELGLAWAREGRGFELAGDDAGWRVRSQAQMAEHIERLQPQSRQKYSKAVLETLAVIAYLQPVTRTVIEQTRGRAVTPGVMQQLEERGWIEVIGHQESPGRPALYATTFKFLDELGLTSIADLPALDEIPLPVSSEAAPPAGPDPDDPWEGEDPRVQPELPLEAAPEADPPNPSTVSAEPPTDEDTARAAESSP